MGCKGKDNVENRFKELVHYVCSLCKESGGNLGAVKLNKILWYIDTSSFCKNGETISGESAYVKRGWGPVPKSILATVEALKEEGALKVEEPNRRFVNRRFVVLKKSEGECFSDDEKSIIKEHTFNICNNHTARSISDKSHDRVWEAAAIGEEIPVYAVLASRSAEITDEDRKWADGVMREARHSGV